MLTGIQGEPRNVITWDYSVVSGSIEILLCRSIRLEKGRLR